MKKATKARPARARTKSATIAHAKKSPGSAKGVTMGYVKKGATSAMKKVAIAAVRNNFSETIDAVRMTGTRLVISKHGKGIAALVSMEDANILVALETADDIRVATRRLKAIREGKSRTLAAEDVYKKLGL